MTDSDIVLVLITLWTRAEDIPCEPRARVAFHAITLIDGICGFRLGCLVNLKYKQFNLGVVRDPEHPEKTKLVVTPTIQHNKRKEKIIRKTQDEK